MPEIVIPIGDEDRYWEPNAIPESRTLRWLSSGTRGFPTIDDRPNLNAHGTMSSPDALSTDDTTSYAALDNPGYEGATTTDFRMGVIASASATYDLPPVAEIASATVDLIVVHRSETGGGTLTGGVQIGVAYTSFDVSYFGGDVAMTSGWTRSVIHQADLYPWSGYDQFRTALASGQVHAHVRSYDLIVYDVAYIAVVVNWVPVSGAAGRLKVLVDGTWKYAVPMSGENDGVGRLKVLVDGVWQYADTLHVNIGDGWAYPNA